MTASPEIIDTMALPDNPVRRERWYQLFCRLWRPTLGWLLTFAAIYIFVVGPAIDRPLDAVTVGYWVMATLAVYGIRAWEKSKGVG
jgi:hypothetical protein